MCNDFDKILFTIYPFYAKWNDQIQHDITPANLSLSVSRKQKRFQATVLDNCITKNPKSFRIFKRHFQGRAEDFAPRKFVTST